MTFFDKQTYTSPLRTLRIVLAGDANSGKTSLAHCLMEKPFTKSAISTIGVEFFKRSISLKSGEAVTLNLWDTAGQERFCTIINSYFRGADGVVLTLACDTDPTKLATSLKWWVDFINLSPIAEQTPIILAISKTDLYSQDEIDLCYQHALDAAYAHNSQGMNIIGTAITSAKNNTGVSKCFCTLAEHIVNNLVPIEKHEKTINLETTDDSATSTRRGCCKT